MSRFHYRQIEKSMLQIIDSMFESYHKSMVKRVEETSPEYAEHLHLIKKQHTVSDEDKRKWMLDAYLKTHEKEMEENRKKELLYMLEELPEDIKNIRQGTDFIYREDVSTKYVAEKMESGKPL